MPYWTDIVIAISGGLIAIPVLLSILKSEQSISMFRSGISYFLTLVPNPFLHR